MFAKGMCLIIGIFVCSCTQSGKKAGASSQDASNVQKKGDAEKIWCTRVPQFDVSKAYEKKGITLNDIAEVTYIPIESANNTLLTNSITAVSHISDNLMIIVNYSTGDCFLFDGKGKMKSKFNHKGNSGSEYVRIQRVSVDEKEKEIYIIDDPRLHRILVYSFDGNYKRRLHIPQDMTIGSILNFDTESLLCNDTKIGSKNKYPYVLLSKSTGDIVTTLNIPFENRIFARFIKKIGENGMMPVQYPYNAIIRSDSSYIIGDVSSDTIYSYSNAKINPTLPLSIYISCFTDSYAN